MTSQVTSIPSSNIQEIAFWDTNTLHYVDIYLQHANEKSFDDRNLKQAYKNGRAALAFCRKEDLHISYSPVSELELIVGRARGKALISAAKENIPERMWSRFQYDEEYINNRLMPAVLEATASCVFELASRLRDRGINVIEGAESGVTETWALARKLLSVVYMSVNDALIYASALLERAKYIVTFDSYFSKTINRCHSGKYKTALAAVFGREISLPQSATPRES